MHPFRIALALVVGGLASPLVATPLVACLRHETPDAAFLAYGLAPVIVAVLALGASALFGREAVAQRTIHTNLHMDGRKIGDVVMRHAGDASGAGAHP